MIDAVSWSDAYPPNSPFRNVTHWYARRLADLTGVSLRVVPAESGLIRTIRRHADAVIISGSPRDAWSDDPMNGKLCEVIHECADVEVPFLGVCYGHQLLGRALGGEVGPHPEGLELGTVLLELTHAGQNFPLFDGLPPKFDALLSHADAVLTLPPKCELLVTGDFTQIQAFHRDHLLMGVQFHPEMDPDTLRFIWSVRRDKWRDKVNFDLDQRLDSLQPTPFASKVLANFVTHFIT